LLIREQGNKLCGQRCGSDRGASVWENGLPDRHWRQARRNKQKGKKKKLPEEEFELVVRYQHIQTNRKVDDFLIFYIPTLHCYTYRKALTTLRGAPLSGNARIMEGERLESDNLSTPAAPNGSLFPVFLEKMLQFNSLHFSNESR
jgi:hypothetical protein